MRYLFSILLIFTFLNAKCQQIEKFNLGFENQKKGEALSFDWFKWGDYDLAIDSLTNFGKKAGKITSTENGRYGSIAYKIPANYNGNTIKLEGYMKMKNVENGFAGLLLRIDGSGNSLAFDNMQDKNITGTKDWEKYSITLDYPEEAEIIIIGGMLTGKGEVWFDNFTVTIDKENIQELKEVKKKLPKAKLDKEFDNGSDIEITELTPKVISNLELLGRVWGFLKYHHPAIAEGNYNWDYELFRFLSKYFKAENNKEKNQLILNWIDSLGSIENCNECKPTKSDAFLKPDLKWIENLDSGLRERISYIYKRRSQGKHYYIQMVSDVGNPDFKHESDYSNMPYPDSGFRLLSLYRYWNMINYFFPYRHLIDKDWNQVLSDYIPIFIKAENELEYELSMLQLIAEIGDSHANLWGSADKVEEWKGEFYPPFHVRFIENKLVIIDYYNEKSMGELEFKKGDIIVKINGKLIEDIVQEKAKYYPASNIEAQLRDFSADILRSSSPKIEITYVSENSEEKSKTLKLYPKDSLNIYRWYRKSDKKSFKMLDNNIGYVTLQTIKKEDISVIKEEFKNTKGIIIDIRNYPSTFVTFSLGSYFVSASTPFAKFTNGSIENPGEFTFTESFSIPSENETYKGKLVVLVNEFSQSQAEYTAMAFRAGDNTTIAGSTTTGADGNVSTIFLPGGLQTRISGIGVYYPNGEETQRVGIVPDIIIKPTIDGIKKNKDEVLDKALEVIIKQ